MRQDNYAIQTQYAKERFLGYDLEALIQKLRLAYDEQYVYTDLFHQRYRIRRRDADFARLREGQWVDANSFAEVLTLLDLICDSRTDRRPANQWKNLNAFGRLFHSNLLEGRDPAAEAFAGALPAFSQACLALGGVPFPQGDAAYEIPFFDGLSVVVQLWQGDEEFPSQLNFLLDANADQYLRYETMHYARGLLLRLIREQLSERKEHP